jgi:hypothetical protein
LSEIIKELVESLLKNLTDRIALGVLLLSVIFLLIMNLFSSSFAIWLASYSNWVYAALLGSLCYLPTRFILEGTNEFVDHRKKVKRLADLTNDEKRILAGFMDNNTKSRRINREDGVAKGLAEEGILYIPDIPCNSIGQMAYNIYDWARLHLKKNPHLVRPDA